jgi:hypothetical protein
MKIKKTPQSRKEAQQLDDLRRGYSCMGGVPASARQARFVDGHPGMGANQFESRCSAASPGLS